VADKNQKTRSGFVSIVGRTNVGKSTLMNHLIGQKIAITANKPQTTRNRIQTVYTDARGQIIFLDMPGVHKAKNKLGEFMMSEIRETVPEGDVILFVVEPSDFIGNTDREIAEKLQKIGKPVLLIINKTDLADKEMLSKAEEAWSQVMHFEKILKVSALRSVHTAKVIDAIFKLLPEGPLYYDEDTLTDQPMRQLVAEMIREKALRSIEDEIPHGIAVTIDAMTQRKNGLWDIDASLICEKESHKGIIIGKGGRMLKKIGAQAREDAEKMLEDQVNLRILVKVRPDWRDSEILLKNFGYQDTRKEQKDS
jgi:GTP-binding protein Era